MMSKKLTNLLDVVDNKDDKVLTSRRDSNRKFKLCIQEKLDNNYNFSKSNSSCLRELDLFIRETVSKNLTISQVENLFLRTKGKTEKEFVNGIKRSVLHFGKDRKSFRIHGFYNEDGYFVIYRIDPNHNKHKC